MGVNKKERKNYVRNTYCKHCIAIQIYYPFQIAWPGAKVCNPEIKCKNKRKFIN